MSAVKAGTTIWPRVALIGFGAIGRTVATLMRMNMAHVKLVGIAKLTAPTEHDLTLVPPRTPFVRTPSDLADLDADLVVECAGHQAVAAFGPQILQRGRDLLIASIGALADEELETILRAEASRSRARILIPSGALGGLDVLAAARLAGLEAVTYIGRKPFRAWKGTRAEQLVNLDDESTSSVVIFDGSARDAANTFPQNANVTAAVALAGLGFDATRVQLIAEPRQIGNEHRVQANGAFGRFEITVHASPLPDNPKSSLLAACSLAKSIFNLHETMVFA